MKFLNQWFDHFSHFLLSFLLSFSHYSNSISLSITGQRSLSRTWLNLLFFSIFSLNPYNEEKRRYLNKMNKLFYYLLRKKSDNYMYKHVPFHCDDCNKEGIVLRQMSVLNVAFWFLLGLIAGVVSGIFSSAGYGVLIGFVVWFGSTYINIKQVKPQCRHCFSTNVEIKKSKE